MDRLFAVSLSWSVDLARKTMALIASFGFNQYSSHIVVFLNNMLSDDYRYLCLVALNKQQIQWTRIQRNQQEH